MYIHIVPVKCMPCLYIAAFLCTIDPEEFLNLLFKHVLHLEPFITIRYVTN